METQDFALYAFVFACGYALATFATFRLIVDKWKAIADKWKDAATRYSKTAQTRIDTFHAASNLALDQAEAIDAIFKAWEDYRDAAATAPTPEGPVETLARINTADRTIRTVMGTLHERTGKRLEDAKSLSRSLPLPEGPQESGPVRPREGSRHSER